jgi:hypothetical protein
VKQINVMALQFKFLDSMKIHFAFGVSLMLEPYHVFTIMKRVPKPPPFMEINDEQKYEVQEIFYSRIPNYHL